ncbi:unannotated protein [freshwater metagenome]|uniref:Unannotated protein n=1 Tax=freshwater metagenome TaxID=449393 RepID=A0A6J7DKR6_9ZZZZ|nr:CpaF family protein [Actinomycetota bacterium]
MDGAANHDRLLAETLRDRLIDEAFAGRAVAPDEFVEREAWALAPDERRRLAGRVAALARGLGPLEPLMADPQVDEILVGGTKPIWVERGGRLAETALRFADEDELREAIDRLLRPVGRRVDEAQPLCDARLPDGSRINVVLPPLAIDGPAIAIRRFRQHGFSAAELVSAGSWTPVVHGLLRRAVLGRLNILVCGSTGSGKTTTLAALLGMLPAGERVVTIEDTAELLLDCSHVVRLEARPPNVEGRGEVTIRALVRNALRMRPDRIVVGEVRGAEALDMLVAMATGHEGSLGTIHAGSPAEALHRLETLVLMAGLGLPHTVVRAQVRAAIDLVVVVARGPGGSRRLVAVAEVPSGAGSGAQSVRQVYELRAGRPILRPPLDARVAARLAQGSA